MAQKILVITPVPLFPAFAGNRQRIIKICRELMNLGYTIDFFYAGYDDHLDPGHAGLINGDILEYKTRPVAGAAGKIVRRATEIGNGLRVRTDRFWRRIRDGKESASYNRSLSEYRNILKRDLLKSETAGKSYTAVIINYAVYAHFFDIFDNQTVKILDTHDLLTNRYNLYLKRGEEPVKWHSLRYTDEKKMIRKADRVWAITGDEEIRFKEMAAGSNTEVLTLRHLLPYREIARKRTGKNLLMAGSANRINLEGYRWFIEHVWPEIRRNHSSASLIAAGSICSALETGELPDGVKLFGRYDLNDEIYSETDICINAMPYGTGLKIKTFEALSHGKVVVSSKPGAKGLEDLEGIGLVIAESASDWISEINRLFESPEPAVSFRNELKQAIEKIYKENVHIIRRSVE